MRIYRAVSDTELQDLHTAGEFRDSVHKTGEKGFYFDPVDAKRMARSFQKMLGISHTVVSTDAPDDVIARGRVHEAAQEGRGVYLLVDDLSLLSPASEEEL
jgi:hypothetical protein